MFKRSNLLLTLALSCCLGQAIVSPADEPKTGEKKDTLLYIRTDPPGAKVLLDGKELGTSDDMFFVDPGVGKVVVELDGYKPGSKQVTIRADGVTRVELTLKPQTGAESVATATEDAADLYSLTNIPKPSRDFPPELTLSNQQEAKLDEIYKLYAPRFLELRNKIVLVLTPDQRKAARVGGGEPLNDEQRKKMVAISDELFSAAREWRHKNDGVLTAQQREQVEQWRRERAAQVKREGPTAPLDLPSLLRSQQSQAQKNLEKLGLGMHNYSDAHGAFPPAVLYRPTIPYSWRIAVLPLLDQQALYEQYHFDEPWDGPNNRKLLDRMPAVFRSPTAPPDSTNTSYFALVGPGTMFDGPKGTKLREVLDGASNTILLVEAKRDIPWTKPEDIPYDPDKPLPELGGCFADGFHALMVDGQVRFLSSTVSEKALRALITKAGGERVKIDDALKPQAATAPAATTGAKPGNSSQDMQKYLSDTQEMVRKGKYQEALERFVWFHEHALEHDPAMTGVRLSFALSDWKALADLYPPAKDAMVEMRDLKTKELTQQLAGGGNASRFQDVAALNRTLGEDQRTVELFWLLDQTRPELAKQCWSFAKDAVIAAKRFDLIRKYIGNPVQEFAVLKETYNHFKTMYGKPSFGESFKTSNENRLVEKSLELIEVALLLDDRKAAQEIQEKALAILDDPRLRDALPVESTSTVALAADEKPASPPAANILTNPGAETGQNAPDAWDEGAAIPGVKYSWDKKVASEGKASLCIEKTAKNYFPIAQWSQIVDRTGNLPKLEVSAQVKARKMTKAIIDVIFYDKQGNSISHQWASYVGSKQPTDPPADHDWKKYTGKVDIPAGTEKICIALQDYGPGKVWFDDVQASYVK